MLSNKHRRPISPHVTVYRMQMNAVLSILHRITGVMLFCAVSFITWWFILLVFSKFDSIYVHFYQYSMCRIIFYFVSFAVFYHLCTGIRHLFWDIGMFFSIKAINITGWIAVICASLLTIIFLLLIIT